MRHNKLIVFASAMSALILMTVVSTLLGYGITSLIPPVYTFYASVVLMFFFGFKMFWDAYRMKSSESEDIQREVENQLGIKEDLGDHTVTNNDVSNNVQLASEQRHCFCSPFLAQPNEFRGRYFD